MGLCPFQKIFYGPKIQIRLYGRFEGLFIESGHEGNGSKERGFGPALERVGIKRLGQALLV